MSAVEPRGASVSIYGALNDPLEFDSGRSRAAVGIGALATLCLAEGRFRVLQAETLTRVDDFSAAGVAGGRDAVAAWQVASNLAEPWIQAVVFGGLIGALAVAVARQSTMRRLTWTLVCAALAYFSLIGIATAPVAAELFERTDASFSRWLQPTSVAAVCIGCAAAWIWVIGPLALRAARPRSSWIVVVIACGVTLGHAAHSFRRGAPPTHPVQVVTRWLIETPLDVRAEPNVALGNFGSVFVAPDARLSLPAAAAANLQVWKVDRNPPRVHEATTNFSSEWIEARWIEADAQQSLRSTEAEPSLITIAVDGLRAHDLDEWLMNRTAPDAIQRCAEAGLLFTRMVTPTPDPRANEAALLSGEHPAARGRAPVAQHLSASLNAAGYLSMQICEGNPRAGVAGHFARVESKLGVDAIPAARRFLASHAAERFHLHLTLERLDLASTWQSDVRTPTAQRPESGETLDQLQRASRAQLAELAVRAPRIDEEAAISVEWRAWFDAAHRARTRELLNELDDLFRDVEAHGLSERCTIVLVGTSGIALGEHGALGFGQELFLPSLTVPLLARGPGFTAGERREGITDMTRIAPTLAELFRVEWSGPTNAIDPSIPDMDSQPVYLHAARGVWNGTPDREIWGVLHDDHALHVCPVAENDSANLPGFGPWRMFRLEADPAEMVDLALIHEFRTTAQPLRAELNVNAKRILRESEQAKATLADWASAAAWNQESPAW